MEVRIAYGEGQVIFAENNGDCYITDAKPDIPKELLAVTVTADDPAYDRTYHNAELLECASVDGRYWFAFHELTADEQRQKEYEDTIQMLTDCILEMSEIIYD